MSRSVGNLVASEDVADEAIANGHVRTIIINCWETAAKNVRNREELLFLIQKWMNDRTITVILYAQKTKKLPKQGYGMRGGFGRLCGVADLIVHDFKEDASDEEQVITKRQSYPELIEEERKFIKETEQATAVEEWNPSDEEEEKTFISASGKEEYYQTYVDDLDGERYREVKEWESKGISKETPKVFSYDNMKYTKKEKVTIWETRIKDDTEYNRSMSVNKSDYDFPEKLPDDMNPVIGTKLEDFLARYRKPNVVHVNNNIIESQEVTDRGTEEVAVFKDAA
jgi:hypothetical protein